MGSVSHSIFNIVHNTVSYSSSTYLLISPSLITESANVNHGFVLREGGAKLWKRLSDDQYILVFGNATSGSNISGTSNHFYFTNLGDLSWSDYFTSPEPPFDNSTQYFLSYKNLLLLLLLFKSSTVILKKSAT